MRVYIFILSVWAIFFASTVNRTLKDRKKVIFNFLGFGYHVVLSTYACTHLRLLTHTLPPTHVHTKLLTVFLK